MLTYITVNECEKEGVNWIKFESICFRVMRLNLQEKEGECWFFDGTCHFPNGRGPDRQ